MKTSTGFRYHLGLLLLGLFSFFFSHVETAALEPEDYLNRENEKLRRQINLLTTAQWELASNITAENEAKVVSFKTVSAVLELSKNAFLLISSPTNTHRSSRAKPLTPSAKDSTRRSPPTTTSLAFPSTFDGSSKSWPSLERQPCPRKRRPASRRCSWPWRQSTRRPPFRWRTW